VEFRRQRPLPLADFGALSLVLGHVNAALTKMSWPDSRLTILSDRRDQSSSALRKL